MITVEHQQRLLLDAGFDPKGIDGIWGKNSQKAYNDWKSAKLPHLSIGNIAAGEIPEIPGHEKLSGVHPDLVKVVAAAYQITETPFKVIEGLRSVRRQRALVAKGASKTMNSRHIPDSSGVGHAVDLAALDDDGSISWSWPLYYNIADAMKKAASELNIEVEWGGDWRSFKDGPHWQLPWSKYPKK
jgi:hypothetical protein